MSWPSPAAQPVVGHLGRWGSEPLALLDEGAALGQVFALRLWRTALIGSSPAWNRFVLTDLDTFRSHGSLSGLSPYLAGGIVASDGSLHRAQRAMLNPGFHRRSVQRLGEDIHDLIERELPRGTFDAVEWSARITRLVLNATLFGNQLPPALMEHFLTPLDSRPPGPFLPRPTRFRRMNRALTAALLHADADTLAPTFAAMSDGVEQARVALSAAYDTTAHTMSWLLWHLADPAAHQSSVTTDDLVSETLRLYPSGWLGSRVAAVDTKFDGQPIPAGTLVCYSPYLTHRDRALWDDPLTFRPERFSEPLPAWGYLPFSAGSRTCLGAGLATLILRTVATRFAGAVSRLGRQPILRAGLTLAPDGPVPLSFSEPARPRPGVSRPVPTAATWPPGPTDNQLAPRATKAATSVSHS